MRILITGGNSGLGKVIVDHLLTRDDLSHLALTYRSKSISNLVDERVEQLHLDFSQSDSMVSLNKFIEKFEIDVLVNNAWQSFELKRFDTMDLDDHREMMQQSLVGTLEVSQAVIRKMKQLKKGKVINILSAYLLGNTPMGVSHYVGSKAYLEAASRSWMTELKKFKIAVHNIYPGPMAIGMNKNVDRRILEMIAMERQSGKLTQATEVAQGVGDIIDWDFSANGEPLILE